MRFLTVGGICYLTTIGINVLLKWTVLEKKPTTALLIATTIASVVSCSPNKRWTFSSRGSRHPEAEAFVSSTGSVRSFLWTRATRSGATDRGVDPGELSQGRETTRLPGRRRRRGTPLGGRPLRDEVRQDVARVHGLAGP
ncbi:GtrA family protein [Kocuria sp. CPCC 205261]|uniref:GtrA family protein n=1 Tax=Kocuria sp. CPCC 205261 TaxID=3073554 RepID=UPI0034D3C517